MSIKYVILFMFTCLLIGCDPVGSSSADVYIGKLIEQQWDGVSTTIVTDNGYTVEVTGSIPYDKLYGAYIWINHYTQTVLIRSTSDRRQVDIRMQLLLWKYTEHAEDK